MRLRTNILFVAATVLAYLSQAPTTREPLNSHWGAVFPPASGGQLSSAVQSWHSDANPRHVESIPRPSPPPRGPAVCSS